MPQRPSSFPETRQSLLLELGRCSAGAWEEFLEVYEDAIYRRCRAKGLQDADALDVTQDVLAAVHQRIPTWDPDSSAGSFRGWLMRVARNLSVDRIAQRAKADTGSGDSNVGRLLNELSGDPSADAEGFELEYRRATFAWATGKVRGEVREITWRIFELTAIDGRDAASVAAELELPVGSVYTAKCRVMARIKDRVAALEDAAD